MTSPQIKKSIRSLRSKIAEHEDKIANPRKYLRPGIADADIVHYRDKYWPDEIRNFRELIDVESGFLKDQRGEIQ